MAGIEPQGFITSSPDGELPRMELGEHRALSNCLHSRWKMGLLVLRSGAQRLSLVDMNTSASTKRAY